MKVNGTYKGYDFECKTEQDWLHISVPALDVSERHYTYYAEGILALVHGIIDDGVHDRLENMADRMFDGYGIPKHVMNTIITWNDTDELTREEIADRLDEMHDRGEINIDLTPPPAGDKINATR